GNISLWCDTNRMLSKVGKDIRNAHYICPTDLQTAHDKLVKKIDEQADENTHRPHECDVRAGLSVP
ncbi:MAG: PcfJ domain-containing protein, partial [Alloprevotella sp.]|nr:PcfJ domain-containing protein [Alloprevotella sp.]